MICVCCYHRQLETVQEKEMGVCEDCAKGTNIIEKTTEELHKEYNIQNQNGTDLFNKLNNLGWKWHLHKLSELSLDTP